MQRILAVDDEPMITRLIEVNLQRAGYQVEKAGDGHEGIMIARSFLPDLIITDMMMPRLDGPAMLQALHSENLLTGVPVLLLTARALDSPNLTDIGLGALNYMHKPFHPEDLKERVCCLLLTRGN